MLDESSAIPLYKQLCEEFRQMILAGSLKHNQKIPTEVELCKTYGVSRMTVRLAMDELQNQGYIYRKQGKGTFVKGQKVEQSLSTFYQFADEVERQGYKTKKVILEYKVLKDEKLSAKLKLTDSTFFYLRRVNYRNETPFSVEISYIPQDICPGLTRKQVDANGLYNSLKMHGVHPDNATENFESILVGESYKKELELENRHAPGFYLERYTYMGERLVEFCTSWVRGDMIRYTTYLKK